MSANKYYPHFLVLPEDDANRQLANGFLLEIPPGATRKIQVLDVADGWEAVLDRFKSDHIRAMDQYPERLVILLIDFDRKSDRLNRAKQIVPNHLSERVFVLGVWTEPESLRADLGSYETIGRAIARGCRDGDNAFWEHDLLQHNKAEVDRLRERIRVVLFP